MNLSAQGFYKTPDIGYDWGAGRGRPYNYYCYGTGCSEVEIDTLTGGFKVHDATPIYNSLLIISTLFYDYRYFVLIY